MKKSVCQNKTAKSGTGAHLVKCVLLNIRNQVNIIAPKETSKALITDLKKMEIYELSNKKSRVIHLRKFSEVQEHKNRQLNEIRKIMHDQMSSLGGGKKKQSSKTTQQKS